MVGATLRRTDLSGASKHLQTLLRLAYERLEQAEAKIQDLQDADDE